MKSLVLNIKNNGMVWIYNRENLKLCTFVNEDTISMIKNYTFSQTEWLNQNQIISTQQQIQDFPVGISNLTGGNSREALICMSK